MKIKLASDFQNDFFFVAKPHANTELDYSHLIIYAWITF